MFLDFMLDRFLTDSHKEFIIWKNKSYDYHWLVKNMRKWQQTVQSHKIIPGTVTIIEADFSPNSVALFLSLIEHGCILVPITSSVEAKKNEFIEIAQGEVSIRIDEKEDSFKIHKTLHEANHEYYRKLRGLGHPGLVLFSSGSEGKSKASVHDFLPLLEK